MVQRAQGAMREQVPVTVWLYGLVGILLIVAFRLGSDPAVPPDLLRTAGRVVVIGLLVFGLLRRSRVVYVLALAVDGLSAVIALMATLNGGGEMLVAPPCAKP